MNLFTEGIVFNVHTLDLFFLLITEFLEWQIRNSLTIHDMI